METRPFSMVNWTSAEAVDTAPSQTAAQSDKVRKALIFMVRVHYTASTGDPSR
jgi:hypothetical protein